MLIFFVFLSLISCVFSMEGLKDSVSNLTIQPHSPKVKSPKKGSFDFVGKKIKNSEPLKRKSLQIIVPKCQSIEPTKSNFFDLFLKNNQSCVSTDDSEIHNRNSLLSGISLSQDEVTIECMKRYYEMNENKNWSEVLVVLDFHGVLTKADRPLPKDFMYEKNMRVLECMMTKGASCIISSSWKNVLEINRGIVDVFNQYYQDNKKIVVSDPKVFERVTSAGNVFQSNKSIVEIDGNAFCEVIQVTEKDSISSLFEYKAFSILFSVKWNEEEKTLRGVQEIVFFDDKEENTVGFESQWKDLQAYFPALSLINVSSYCVG